MIMTFSSFAKAFGSAFCALALVSSAAFADSYASVSVKAQPSVVKAGAAAKILVRIKLKNSDFHINANKPNDDYLIPTTLTVKPVPGVKIGGAVYPKPVTVKESYSDKPMLVYKGAPVISVPVVIGKAAKKGKLTITGELKFQGCDHSSCYPPQTETISATVVVK